MNAEMPECNALGIVGRDDARPQIPKAKARKVRVPSSSGEEEEASESKAEIMENSEVESARSTEDSDGDDDGDDDDDDDDESGGDDAGVAARDEEGEAEEGASSPHPAEGRATVPSPKLSPRAPPEVGEDSGPMGMEVEDDAFVVAPRCRGSPRRQSPALEPSFATSVMPPSPHGSSAGSVGMPESLGHKRPRG